MKRAALGLVVFLAASWVEAQGVVAEGPKSPSGAQEAFNEAFLRAFLQRQRLEAEERRLEKLTDRSKTDKESKAEDLDFVFGESYGVTLDYRLITDLVQQAKAASEQDGIKRYVVIEVADPPQYRIFTDAPQAGIGSLPIVVPTYDPTAFYDELRKMELWRTMWEDAVRNALADPY